MTKKVKEEKKADTPVTDEAEEKETVIINGIEIEPDVEAIPLAEMVTLGATDTAKSELQARCIWHTKVIVPGRLTPSGRRYQATPGEIITITNEADYEFLIGYKRGGDRCAGCGGTGPSVRHYFQEV